MSNLLVWVLRGLLALCLQLRYPAARFQNEEPVRRDPSYAVYETYRYAYERYGYLFSYAEETGGEGAGPAENRSWQGGSGNAGAVGGGQESTGADGRVQGGNGDLAGWNGLADGSTGAGGSAGSAGTEAGQAGNGTALPAAALAQLQDYDYLMKHYFSVHASTTADRGLMKAEKLLGTDVRLTKNPEVPQILIYHTHASETYADYGPRNPDANVVGAGTYLAELLRQRGWNVIHDTTAYDRKEGTLERSRAYTYALEGIQGILQEHPTIEVILDLHRDGVSDSLRLVQDIGGKPTAQIMFFQGMSRTPEGEIAYLPNPYLQENLAFCFQMQLACGRYPGFTRKIYLKGLRYNLHLRGRSSLIEAGAQISTKEEVWNAMDLLAEAVDAVLQPVVYE